MANNLENLLAAYTAQVQDLETAYQQLLLATRLENAEGIQLDNIGIVVGVVRGAASDDRYRDLIAAQIATNLASGTIEEINNVVRLVIGELTFDLTEYFPAAFEVDSTAQSLPVGQGSAVAVVVDGIRAAGVNGYFRWYEVDPVFRLDGAGGSVFDGGYFFSTSL